MGQGSPPVVHSVCFPSRSQSERQRQRNRKGHQEDFQGASACSWLSAAETKYRQADKERRRRTLRGVVASVSSRAQPQAPSEKTTRVAVHNVLTTPDR